MFGILFGFLVIGFAATSPTQKSLEDVRIIGGEEIEIAAVPFQVSILNRGRHTCGGAIIASDLILTAAHCVIGVNSADFQIRVGSSSNLQGGLLIQVGDLVWHKSFNFAQMDNDIAVLWLATPLDFDDKVAPIPLVRANEEIVDGGITMVTGWGSLKEGGGISTSLQVVYLPKVNSNTCNRAYYPSYKITPRMLCAGLPTGGKDACQGDSGGPLVYRGKLAGIVSWGLGCARPKYPGVYAKVSALRSWIDDSVSYLRLKHVLRSIE